jgi:hypothetical protein
MDFKSQLVKLSGGLGAIYSDRCGQEMIMQNPYDPVRPTVFRLYTGSQNIVLLKINPFCQPARSIE